ncbi:methionyl-tRNA formyltransferase [Capnocytophaga stomatis]|nr:methionyl-tRNA formyltransferase [Capnocytophaga stomatis]
MGLEYNTERTPLIIPEYGRHIQKMIEKAITIEDREKRNNTAKSIIAVMGNMFPHLRDVPDFQHKLWDQLFIMSKFQLDVDSPFEKPTSDVLIKHPDILQYPQNHPKYRFYGNNIKKMIEVCVGWEEGHLKEALKYAIANHMKKSYLTWNKEAVEDEVVFQHLYELSDGKIDLAKTKEFLTNSNELIKTKQNLTKRASGQTKKAKRTKNT